MTRIAVTGATGRVGRHVVDLLQTEGHDVVPIARSAGVDVITREGLDEALAGVEVVIDTATSPTPDEQEAVEFFTTSARNLQEAGARAGVRRIVDVSIIGADRFPSGYNVGKIAQERALAEGPIPVLVLRAAQFHEFVEQLVAWGTQGDVAYVWDAQTQLVAARTVAEELVALATGPGDAPAMSEIAGPRAESLVEVARAYVARRGGGLRVEGVHDPSNPEHVLYASGALLPGPGAKLAGPSYEEWLEAAAAVTG